MEIPTDNFETNLVYATMIVADEGFNALEYSSKLIGAVRGFTKWEEENVYGKHARGWEEMDTDYESALFDFVMRRIK